MCLFGNAAEHSAQLQRQRYCGTVDGNISRHRRKATGCHSRVFFYAATYNGVLWCCTIPLFDDLALGGRWCSLADAGAHISALAAHTAVLVRPLIPVNKTSGQKVSPCVRPEAPDFGASRTTSQGRRPTPARAGRGRRCTRVGRSSGSSSCPDRSSIPRKIVSWPSAPGCGDGGVVVYGARGGRAAALTGVSKHFDPVW